MFGKGLAARLFFLILCSTGLVILCLFLIMWWNIDHGFYQYLGAMEQQQLTAIVADLSGKYKQYANWDFLKKDWPRWNDNNAMPFLLPKKDLMPLPPQPYGHHAPPVTGMPPPGYPDQHPDVPLVILNADKKPVYGFYPPDEDVSLRPIMVGKETVGYAGILSPRHFLHPMQIDFLSRQKLALVMGATGMVVIVIVVSLPLARRLVRPIKAMATATNDIASGHYGARISFSSSDELGQLARDFNAMALTLERHEKERRQWVADISHELRTPVAVLQGEIEALLDGIRQISPETIRSLHAETMRLKRLVEDLYQISLSDLGAMTCHKKNLDLRDVIAESIDFYRTEFERKGIALKVNLPSQASMACFADPERLNQLFTNLLENSVRYTDAGGVLEITASLGNSGAAIEFQDSKPGVGEQDAGRLFERFYRVEASRSRRSGGAGLGLTICKNIVDAHEGTIFAYPSPLGGLGIRITLPVEEMPHA